MNNFGIKELLGTKTTKTTNRLFPSTSTQEMQVMSARHQPIPAAKQTTLKERRRWKVQSHHSIPKPHQSKTIRVHSVSFLPKPTFHPRKPKIQQKTSANCGWCSTLTLLLMEKLIKSSAERPAKIHTLQEINISHLGKRKIIFKYALSGGYVNCLEGKWKLSKKRCPYLLPILQPPRVLPPATAPGVPCLPRSHRCYRPLRWIPPAGRKPLARRHHHDLEVKNIAKMSSCWFIKIKWDNYYVAYITFFLVK